MAYTSDECVWVRFKRNRNATYAVYYSYLLPDSFPNVDAIPYPYRRHSRKSCIDCFVPKIHIFRYLTRSQIFRDCDFFVQKDYNDRNCYHTYYYENKPDLAFPCRVFFE